MVQSNSQGFKFKGFGSDPYSNTGSNSQNVSARYNSQPPTGKQGRLDGLAGTLKYSDNKVLVDILDLVSRHVDQKPLVRLGKTVAFHNNRADWECGMVVGWNEPERDEKTGEVVKEGRIYVSFLGKALTRLYEVGGYMNMWGIFQILDSVYSFKPTRFDAACDDYDKSLNVAGMKKALIAGNYSGFKKAYEHWDFGKGWTYELGSRQSDEFARIYNKEYESEGLIKSFRMEREFHDEKAEKAFKDWMNITPDEWETTGSAFLISLAIGKVNFIDRAAYPEEKNLNRIPVLSWWESWTKDIVPTGYSKTKVVHSLDRTLTWVQKQVARMMAVAKRAMGTGDFHNWRNRLEKWADQNLSKEQEYLASEWRADYLRSSTA